jgi:hypothetical protein
MDYNEKIPLRKLAPCALLWVAWCLLYVALMLLPLAVGIWISGGL